MDKAAIILGVVSILAILLGPILALEVQRRLDKGREATNRKMWVFKTLMAHRATNLAPLFVQALNMIDVEFDGDNEKEKAVRNAWKVLLDHFADLGGDKIMPNALEKSQTLTTNLLLSMGKCLGYDFDEVHVKKGGYYPRGLGNVEEEQHTLRREVLELLKGNRKLPIAIFEDKFPSLLPQKPDISPPHAKSR